MLNRSILSLATALALTTACGGSDPGPTRRGDRDGGDTSGSSCDGVALDPGEFCDGAHLRGETCEGLGFGGGGTLACRSDCSAYNTSGCRHDPCQGPDTYAAGGNSNLGDGEPCNRDSDCQSASGCNADFYCGPNGVTPVDHTSAKLPIGRACDAHASCGSGYCYAGGDVWFCAATCDTPVSTPTPGELNCLTITDSDVAPAGGSACIPVPDGAVGDACDAGTFDCTTGLCLGADFCTDVCDPTASPSTCPAGSTCAFLTAVAQGEIWVCVADGRIGASAEGGNCTADFDCADPLVCFDGSCTRLCPGGDGDCTKAGTYCASDHPAGAICVDDSTKVAPGASCEFSSQCPATDPICFDPGDGAICSRDCVDTNNCGGTDVCVTAETGPSLDTAMGLFDASENLLVENDDPSGSSRWAALTYDSTGTAELLVAVQRFPGSPAGPYRIDLFLDTPSDYLTHTEVEGAGGNGTPGTADDLTTDILKDVTSVSSTRIVGSFVDGASADLDFYRIAVDFSTGATLNVVSGATLSGVCIDGGALAADGDPCSNQSQCQNDCFPFMRTGPSFCARPCAGDGVCGGGTCRFFDDTDPPSGYCFDAGSVSIGSKTFGEICNGPHECGSLMCAKHRYEDVYRCVESCSTVGAACAGSGVCNGTDPIYGEACIPHLGGTVAAGGDCRFDQDCSGSLVCTSDVCIEAGTSNYKPSGNAAAGFPCNYDSDCASSLICVDFACVPDASYVGCVGDAPNGSVDDHEICDPDAGGVLCADLGLGSGYAGCLDNCLGYDFSTCSNGLPDGEPCNGDTDCQTTRCYAGADVWYCVQECSGPTDTCSEQLYDKNTICSEDPFGGFSCIPEPGTKPGTASCLSGYLDCASGRCWNGSFCVDGCSPDAPDCGRDATCVSYEEDRAVDTELSILGGAGGDVGPIDDAGLAQWSAATYTNAGGSMETVYVKVEAANGSGAVGDYQLQLFVDAAPPPFGVATLESESNDTEGTAQGVDDATPRRIDANLSSQDVDYFRVNVYAGETLTALTTYPLAHFCWPNDRLGKTEGDPCSFGFECPDGLCTEEEVCADECTATGECGVGYACGRPVDWFREFCFEPFAFGESCENAPTEIGDTDGTLVPLCPNGVCLPPLASFSGTYPVCSDICVTPREGTPCGPDGTGSFGGECIHWNGLRDDSGVVIDVSFDGQYVCIPHFGGTEQEGEGCIADADCTTDCCERAADRLFGTCVSGTGTCNAD